MLDSCSCSVADKFKANNSEHMHRRTCFESVYCILRREETDFYDSTSNVYI